VRNSALLAIFTILLGVIAPGQVTCGSTTAQRAWFDHAVEQLRGPVGQRPPNLQERRAVMAPASADVVLIRRPPEAQELGGIFGKLPVPLERRHPDGTMIRIYFEVYPHTNAGPAVSAILANPGGPGASTTGLRALGLALFAQNRHVHHFLLIDDRGRGGSDAC